MTRRLAAVAFLSLTAGAASAAPCHDVLGAWNFTLACGSTTTPPHFGTRLMDGEITHQEGCVFLGMLLGRPWVGVLSGAGNRTVTFDFGGAKAQGELDDRRGGLFREMSIVYTYEGSGETDPPTACTGTATRG